MKKNKTAEADSTLNDTGHAFSYFLDDAFGVLQLYNDVLHVEKQTLLCCSNEFYACYVILMDR